MPDIKKLLRLSSQSIKYLFINNPLFLHILPTTRCNLSCEYCYQHDNTSCDMRFNIFCDIIINLKKQGLSIVSFTGGEPLLWSPLARSVDYCSSEGLISHVATNGTLLNFECIDNLSKAGLDYLSVSVDSVEDVSWSSKNIEINRDIFDLLIYARNKCNITVSFNAVLIKHNYRQIYRLIELSKKKRIPMSIGYVVENITNKDRRTVLGFGRSERNKVRKIAKRIIDYKKRGCLIIEPERYFSDIEKYLMGQMCWDCYVAKKKTIQVAPDGRVLWCTKLGTGAGYDARHMNVADYEEYTSRLKKIVRECNNKCYSNCAYNAFYFYERTIPYLYNIAKIASQTCRGPRK